MNHLHRAEGGARAMRPRRITDRHIRATRLQIQGDYRGAIAMWRRVLKKHPRDPVALYYVSLAFYAAHDLERAIQYMRASVQVEPKEAKSWYNLGKMLQDRGDMREALQHYIAALEVNPKFAEAYTNAGNLFAHLGDEESALGCYHMSLAQDVDNPEAKYNRSFLELLHGDFKRGIRDYEYRWQCPAFVAEHGRHFMRGADAVPMWDGSPLNGRTLLIHAEQGAGDTIQHIRFVHGLEAAGLVLEVHDTLLPLVQNTFPDVPTYKLGDTLPRTDLRVPLMSLSAVMGVESEAQIPAKVPYLTPPPATHTIATPGPNVGLVWGGSKSHPNDKDRSTTLDQLSGLMEVPKVTWHSLQIGERADEAEAYPKLLRYDEHIHTFADTAGLIAQLDLVVSVDTSTAHLAGALGVPVWCMVPSVPEFRWMLGREDSPWYPTMRVWRRRPGGGWGEMVRRMRTELERWR